MSFLIGSLRLSLTSPSTLERLKFDIDFTDYDNGFNHDWFFESLRDADFWSHLDSIITHPSGSRLQRVDINIYHAFRDDDNVLEPYNNEASEPVLNALPLLREKGILFITASVKW